ncbi:MAG: hypothetical protein KatS3mg038_1579 [Candidatus Kapaibacterium sp.]|nr:MAG: hypothetical protein KatS3mg038_1579 [Candidatus Kapabacteria bacterium]
MADIYAIANGNWSNPAIWSGGVVPGVSDNVWLNGKTITLDQDISVASLSSEANATLGTVAGGGFNISSTTRNVTCANDIRQGGVTALFSVVAPCIFTVNASTIYTSTDSSASSTFRVSSGTGSQARFDVNSNITVRQAPCFSSYANDLGTINIYGNVQTAGSAYAVSSHNVTINLTGNVTGSLLTISNRTGNVTVNGNVTQSGNIPCINYWDSTCTITINGNIYSNTSSAILVDGFSDTYLALTINGHVYGGTSSNAYAINVNKLTSQRKIQINGDLYSGTGGGAHAVYTATFDGVCIINGNIRVQTGGALKTPAIGGRTWLVSSNAQYIEQWEANLTTGQPTGNKLIFETNINANQANPADVRQGVVYGPAGEYTGTLAVPPPQAVAYGVPVDDTVGQAGLPPYRAVAEYRGG